jgi:capsid protein
MEESCKKCMNIAIFFISKMVKEMVCDWLIKQSNEGLINIPNHDKFIEDFNKKFNCKYKKE